MVTPLISEKVGECNSFDSHHQLSNAKPSGAVTVMIRVRQSFTRKAKPASSMLPADQDRLPITPIKTLCSVSTHSMPAGEGQLYVYLQYINNNP